MSPPVQELPRAYKLVHLYRLPLRGRHAESSCPTNMERTIAVGRDHRARRCRNYRLRTNLFVYTVCRFADGGDMSPPYSFPQTHTCSLFTLHFSLNIKGGARSSFVQFGGFYEDHRSDQRH